MSEQKNEKGALVPRLRFPGFTAPWAYEPLSKVLKENKLKNTSGREVFSVSMEYGVVNQIELLGRSFAAADTSHYTIGRRYDVVYTKSPLKAFPFGIVKQCKFDGEAALSPLYGVFTPHNPHLGLMIEAYFESPNRSIAFLTPLCQKGAKNTIQITNTTFLSGKLPLPTERAEQQKIADCLSSLDELIAAESQKLTTLKTHKKGLMQQLFPREGETVPRLRFPEFRDAGEWENKSLGEVCDVLQGYGFPEALQGRTKGKYPFCKVSDISRAVAENGGILVEAANYVGDDELSKLRAKPIPPGTTVFAKIGEALRLNRRAFVRTECLIDNNAVGLKAIHGCADDYFVYLLSQLIDLNKHCGGAVPSVNKSTLEAIEVVVPKPKEQKQIAASLSSLDDLITAQTQKIAALKTHKKGLMQQLFPVLDEVQP